MCALVQRGVQALPPALAAWAVVGWPRRSAPTRASMGSCVHVYVQGVIPRGTGCFSVFFAEP